MAAVRKIGNVNKDYFIMGDEVDYFKRLRSAGKVLTLKQNIFILNEDRAYTKTKVFYLVRNSQFCIDYILIKLDKKYVSNINCSPARFKKKWSRSIFIIFIWIKQEIIFSSNLQRFKK